MTQTKASDILITGGSGYIGSSLAAFFSERKMRVSTLDVRPQPGHLKAKNIPHLIADIGDYNYLKEKLADISLVIHTAIVQIPRINEEKKLGYKINVLGTQNLCKIVDLSDAKGMILAGSWHVFGESELRGVITEGFGYRPDKVENRSRMYALCKNAQELVVRLYNEFSSKVFAIIRMGTVLGENMPPKTAANIFVDQALRGEDLTPFKHSMYRPMMYVSIRDIQKGFYRFSRKILSSEYHRTENSLDAIINLLYPQPISIFELANSISAFVGELTNGNVCPKVKVVDKGLPLVFEEGDASRVKFDVSRSKELLDFDDFISPQEEIERIIESRWKELRKRETSVH